MFKKLIMRLTFVNLKIWFTIIFLWLAVSCYAYMVYYEDDLTIINLVFVREWEKAGLCCFVAFFCYSYRLGEFMLLALAFSMFADVFLFPYCTYPWNEIVFYTAAVVRFVIKYIILGTVCLLMIFNSAKAWPWVQDLSWLVQNLSQLILSMIFTRSKLRLWAARRRVLFRLWRRFWQDFLKKWKG